MHTQILGAKISTAEQEREKDRPTRVGLNLLSGEGNLRKLVFVGFLGLMVFPSFFLLFRQRNAIQRAESGEKVLVWN